MSGPGRLHVMGRGGDHVVVLHAHCIMCPQTRDGIAQNEAVASLKKARQLYMQRSEDLEKAKAVTAKALDDTAGHKTLDKRRKSRDDAQGKVRPTLEHVPYILGQPLDFIKDTVDNIILAII